MHRWSSAMMVLTGRSECRQPGYYWRVTHEYSKQRHSQAATQGRQRRPTRHGQMTTRACGLRSVCRASGSKGGSVTSNPAPSRGILSTPARGLACSLGIAAPLVGRGGGTRPSAQPVAVATCLRSALLVLPVTLDGSPHSLSSPAPVNTLITPRHARGSRVLVPGAGLEPARSCDQGILSPRCLPFHHPGMFTSH